MTRISSQDDLGAEKNIILNVDEIEVEQIRKIFLNPEVANVDEIKFNEVDYEGIVNYLVKERSFSEDRIQSTLNRLKKALEKKSQNLDQWF